MSEISAYHEAGHAFMAVTVGASVQSLTIDPDWDDGPERYADTQVEWPRDRFSDQEFREKSIQVALAGPVAEMIHTGDAFHPGIVAEWAGDWRAAWKTSEEFLGDHQKRLAYLERTTVELYQLFSRDDCWAAIAAIADHLEAHETLEGEDVVEIVSQWMG